MICCTQKHTQGRTGLCKPLSLHRLGNSPIIFLGVRVPLLVPKLLQPHEYSCHLLQPTIHTPGRIIEYPSLKGTHKDHRVQLLPPHRANQNPNPRSEGAIQTLPEYQHSGPCPLPRAACSMPTSPDAAPSRITFLVQIILFCALLYCLRRK